MKKTILFVDDEPNVISGLRRMLRSMRKDWDMYFAQSGKEALDILAEKSIEVIVTDMRMPGMDGATLLEKVREQYPHVVRIILSGHSDKEMILRSARYAHQFLVKPCGTGHMKKTVERACHLRDTLRDENLLKIVTGIKALPSLPAFYFSILEELHSPEVSLKKIGDIIAQDVTMTAKILQFVNSAFFGLPQKVVSPHQAVTFLGLDTVKALVLYVNIFSTIKPSPGPGHISLPDLWNHSQLVGSLCRKIAASEISDRQVVDEACIAGMLHDIGKLVLLDMPGYNRKVKGYRQEKGCSNLEAEYAVLGTSHAELGAYLLGLWGFPDTTVEPVAYHHCPSRELGTGFSLVSVVHGANALVKNNPYKGKVTYEFLDMGYIESRGLQGHLEKWGEIYGNMTI